MARNRVFGAAGVRFTLLIALAPGLIDAPLLATDLKPRSGNPGEVTAQAAQLLRSGKVESAAQLVRAALSERPGDTPLLCMLGEILFRRADFLAAATAYEEALRVDPSSARAYWGLGRIEQLLFRRKSARDLFAKAYRLDARDPDIIWSYAGFTPDPRARSVLLNNIVALTRETDPARAKGAVAQLEIEQRLRQYSTAGLATPYTKYQLKLTGFHPTNSAPNGLLVAACINGSKPLHLVFDTGARGILIQNSAARDLGLETVVGSQVEGLGASAVGPARLTLARSISFGNLEFRNALVEVSGKSLVFGADGVVGANVFERFTIRVDAHARVLELIPFADEPSTTGAAEPWPAYDRSYLNADFAQSIPAYGLGHLLLLKARVNGGKEGLFLLDTGAAFTVVSDQMISEQESRTPGMPLFGVRGNISNAIRLEPIEFQIAGRPMVESTPLRINLQQMSQQQGIEISGVLGYSVLSQVAVTINYRDGLVQFDAHAGRPEAMNHYGRE